MNLGKPMHACTLIIILEQKLNKQVLIRRGQGSKVFQLNTTLKESSPLNISS
jgi:hypothetical protein